MLVSGVVAAGLVPPIVATATVPPGDGAGVAIVRLQAETAAAEFFAASGAGGASHVACETPSADTAGVVFYCYGVNGAGAPLVAQATINDYGAVDIAALASGSTATTAPPTTTSPVLSAAQGTGSQVVQVNPVSGPAILGVTHDGAGAFAVQPQQGGVPLGGPLLSVTGAWSGRYLVGLGGTISAFDVTADGDWTLTVEQRGTALVFDAAAGVVGENPDVVAYSDAAPWSPSLIYDGSGPIVVRAVTVTGDVDLVNQDGPFSGTIDVPAGPGFVTIDAAGAWSLQPATPPTTST